MKAIFFDFGGTLFSYASFLASMRGAGGEGRPIFVQAAERLGVDVDRRTIGKAYGKASTEAFRKYNDRPFYLHRDLFEDTFRVFARELGAEAVVVPMIRLAPPADLAELDAALGRLAGYDALLFTSANAVRFFAARAEEIGGSILEDAPPIACVGPITAEAARSAGFSVALVPSDRCDATAPRDGWRAAGIPARRFDSSPRG